MPTSRDETPVRLFFAGSLSGVLSVFVTYPLELIRVRLAFDTKHKPNAVSFGNIVRRIYTEGQGGDQTILERFPVLKFYRGFSATVMGMIPYAGTSFLVFGRCKALLYALFLGQDTYGNPVERSVELPQVRVSKTTVDLCSGALAGAISQTVSYPLEVIRRRQQVGGLLQPARMLRISDTIRWIYSNHGLRGFYVGLSIGYIKVIPMTAISFAVWSGVKRQLGI
ncbi:coenzyme A transporter [Malassezia cuniculi]|uniref:Coenzyme A transporter n=1 Tax=Malassezia cuniculi TaxID=948313 RepID=A0AAF0J854_9BASI|nr:coenzyme A transporter [Malassezia cuniculi]